MKKSIKNYISKTFITIIIFLVILILFKTNLNFKSTFYKYVFESNLPFSKINKIYNNYFGKILEIPTYKENTVFDEKFIYTKKEKYFDGVKLNVGSNYLVHAQESGIVVYIGNKENYGNVVIIQQINGIDIWYGNINNPNVKLYKYIKKGELIGDVNEILYLVYKKDGNILNYEDYIQN